MADAARLRYSSRRDALRSDPTFTPPRTPARRVARSSMSSRRTAPPDGRPAPVPPLDPDAPLTRSLERTADALGARPALIEEGRELAFDELLACVRQVARALARRGVGPGESVVLQLPNWWETAVAVLATTALGARAVPVVPILRARELAAILRETRPGLGFAAGRHRGVDHVARLREAAAALPSLHIVATRPAEGGAPAEESFDDLLAETPMADLPEVDPRGDAVVVYTSGSTAAPKGARHSHRTLTAELASLVAAHRLGPGDRVLMPSPLAHVSGLVHGILAPALLGTSAVLMERWDATAAIAAIERYRVTYLVGAPTFLQEILARPEVATADLSSLRLYSCGGASVPPELLRAGRRRLPRLVAKRVYGSSEFPTIATTTAEDAIERGLDSEGRALPGVEIRICDEAGRPLPPGVEGEIRARGPDCFLGYVDASLDREAFDADGFLRTGDLGTLDADSYLRVTGRVKDIIVRKGEKISAREVEDLIAEHPAVEEVALIPLRDERTGERACACIRVGAGRQAPTLEELVAFLRDRDLTPQKLPEQLEVLSEFPRTPSGKVHKRVLRERFERGAPRRGV